MDRFDDWISFCSVLHQNEPRFLRRVEFPDKYVELCRAFIDEVGEDLRGVPFEESRAALEDDAATINLATGTLESIRLLVPSLARDANALRIALESDLAEREGQIEADAVYDYDAREDEEPPAGRSAQLETRAFSIDSIFADL